MRPTSSDRALSRSARCAVRNSWRFATSPYEQGRYARILDAIGERPVARAFEPGCSIGVLTEQLARRCDHVVASDVSPSAVAAAAARCAGLANVEITVSALPDLPQGTFDLIVFSEIGYYFDERGLMELLGDLTAILEPGGRLVAAHWTGRSPDHVLTGETVHHLIGCCRSLVLEADADGGRFILGTWSRSVT